MNNFRRFYSRFFKSEKTDCTAHFKFGQEQVSLTCNILTGDTFTGKTNFFFIPPMQGERAEFVKSKFICVKRHGVGAAICRPLFGYQHGRIISAPTSDGAVINFDEQLFCPSLALEVRSRSTSDPVQRDGAVFTRF